MKELNPEIVEWVKQQGRDHGGIVDERLVLADAAHKGYSWGEIAAALESLGVVTRHVGTVAFWLFPDSPPQA